jgi:hypothetical protein
MPDRPAVSLRPATLQDRFVIRRLLAGPGAHETWGNMASAEAEITLAMESNAALARMVMRDEAAIGYAQAVDGGMLSEDLRDEVPAGSWRVAYFLGSGNIPDSLAVGAAILSLLTEEEFATSLAVACTADVSIRTETSTRAYERAGFRWLRVAHDPAVGPSWLMLKERPAPRPDR